MPKKHPDPSVKLKIDGSLYLFPGFLGDVLYPPPAVYPEPVVRRHPYMLFNDSVEKRRIIHNVSADITGSYQRNRRAEHNLIAPVFLTNIKRRNHRCTVSKGEHGKPFVGTGDSSEKRYINALIPRGILVQKDADNLIAPKQITDHPRTVVFIDD